MIDMKEQLRELPKMTHILERDSIKKWTNRLSQLYVKKHINYVLEAMRDKILNTEEPVDTSVNIIEKKVIQLLETKTTPSLCKVINATGTALHTNLGRALLDEKIFEEMKNISTRYNNLEYQLDYGQRGSRYSHVENILTDITGAEAALVVNNNAAAVMLLLTATVPGSEVLVSRGELVEIGGSFRIPDVIESVGATLKEVGATNKTHIRDYEEAITEATGALLRVHTSNYRIVGFSQTPDDNEIISLARRYNIPAFNDLGSGLLIDLQSLGLPYEPIISEVIKAGYDVVSFSGDKLLGGPQAGILVGKRKYIDKLKKHPLLRALRVDKLTISALESVLSRYLQPDTVFKSIPLLKILNQSEEILKEKAKLLSREINNLNIGYHAKVVQGYSQVGGGAYPGVTLSTSVVEVKHDHYSDYELERWLRLSEGHIITRVSNECVQFDVRTLLKGDIQTIVNVLYEIAK